MPDREPRWGRGLPNSESDGGNKGEELPDRELWELIKGWGCQIVRHLGGNERKGVPERDLWGYNVGEGVCQTGRHEEKVLPDREASVGVIRGRGCPTGR